MSIPTPPHAEHALGSLIRPNESLTIFVMALDASSTSSDPRDGFSNLPVP